MGRSHDHGHHHGAPSFDEQHRHSHAAASVGRIKRAFVLNMVFAVVELVGGIWSGSTAIVADAVHDLGDSVSLALALYLQKKSNGHPSDQLTYGYRRFSVLSAVGSGLVIIFGSSMVLLQSIPKLFHQESVPHTSAMIGLAVLGLVVNGLAAVGLSRGHSHNERILSWHLFEDVLGWLVVLIGAGFIHVFGWAWLDPLLAVGISLFVLYNVIKNLREPLRVLLQYAPTPADVAAIRQELSELPSVVSIEQMHAWTLDGFEHVFSGRITLEYGSDAIRTKESMRILLVARGYRHITLELECRDAASGR